MHRASFGGKRERVEQENAFGARFGEKLAAFRARGLERVAVIDPGNARRTEKGTLKLRGPSGTFERQPGALIHGETVAVEFDVPRFIAQDEIANLNDGGIVHMSPQQAVVGGAHEFGDDQDLNLEFYAQRAAHDAENQMRPMPRDDPPAKSSDELGQQSRVLLFLLNEEIERFPIIRITGVRTPGFGEEESSLTALTELEVRKRIGERTRIARCERDGMLRGDLGAVETVGFKVSEPLRGVHKVSGEFGFE